MCLLKYKTGMPLNCHFNQQWAVSHQRWSFIPAGFEPTNPTLITSSLSMWLNIRLQHWTDYLISLGTRTFNRDRGRLDFKSMCFLKHKSEISLHFYFDEQGTVFHPRRNCLPNMIRTCESNSHDIVRNSCFSRELNSEVWAPAFMTTKFDQQFK